MQKLVFVQKDLYNSNIKKMISLQLSLCNERLRELPNPGASGSIFYVTHSDEFIIKTVQHKEAEFLQKLLPGYYMVIETKLISLLSRFCWRYHGFIYPNIGHDVY